MSQFSDLIMCSFQDDFCNWTPESSDEKYSFFRETSDGLEKSNITGPKTDNFEHTDKYFVLTSNYQAQEVLAGSTATLVSPYFPAKEHPVECFFFFFYLDVSPLEVQLQ